MILNAPPRVMCCIEWQIQGADSSKVGEWCRATYKRTKLASTQNDAINMVARRIDRRADLRFAQYAEAVVWTYFEEKIFSAWFPGLGSIDQEHLDGLHRCIAAAGESACNAAKRR